MQASNTATAVTASSPSLFQRRFDIGVIAADCGQEPLVESYDAAADAINWPLVDYSDYPPTIDQEAINAWFAAAPLEGKRILHVGVGNSSLAALTSERAERIVGVTVSVNELRHAQSLALPGYTSLLLNKHGEDFAEAFTDDSFDYVVDNNLTSFACCQKHFERYVAAITRMLADGGAVVTHWLGMRWVLDVGVGDVERAWLLDEAKLATIADAFGLVVHRQGDLFFLQRVERHGPR